MTLASSAVVYDGLPVSSGGAHSIKRLGPEQALHAWRQFLAACGHVDVMRAMVRVDDGPGPPAPRTVLRRVDQLFPTRREGAVRLHDVPADRLDDAVELIGDISPQAADEWGNAAVTLFVEADFVLGRPTDDQPWPGQGRQRFGGFETPGGPRLGVCDTRLILTTTRAMGLTVCLPEATDDDVALARPWLQEHLPFRMSSRHWTRWTLTKNGRTYRPRRISVA